MVTIVPIVTRPDGSLHRRLAGGALVMTGAWHLLARLHAVGAEVKADGDRLVLCASLGALSDELKDEASASKADLLALVRPPAPAAGACLFFEGDRAKTCWPEEAGSWTYEGAPRWYYVREHPVPACEPTLAAYSRRRCPGC